MDEHNYIQNLNPFMHNHFNVSSKYSIYRVLYVYSWLKSPKKSIKMYCHHQINKLLQWSFNLFTYDRQLADDNFNYILRRKSGNFCNKLISKNDMPIDFEESQL